MTVHDDQPSADPEHANPFVDGRLRMRKCPEHVASHDEVEAASGERQLLGVALLELDRGGTLGRLAPRLGDHGGREVDAGDTMTTRRELEGEEAGAPTAPHRPDPPPAPP